MAGFGAMQEKAETFANSTQAQLAQLCQAVWETNRLLTASLTQEDSKILELVATDHGLGAPTEIDSPAPGYVRLVVERKCVGGTQALTTAREQVRRASKNRLGGNIVNSGEKAVRLWLCGMNDQIAGVGTILLSAGGGSWDYRLGNILWDGSITGAAIEGTSTLEVTEV